MDKAYLLSEAQRLDIRNQVDSMLQFLQTHKRPTDSMLPTWNEFLEKAADYKAVVKWYTVASVNASFLADSFSDVDSVLIET